MKIDKIVKIFIFGILLSSNIFLFNFSANAVTRGEQDTAFIEASGMSPSASISTIVSTIISVVLGLLGIIFIVLLVLAGFQWMTAQGNEEKVEKAKTTISRAVIGLIIVVAAYSITYFVFNALNESAGGGGVVNHSN